MPLCAASGSATVDIPPNYSDFGSVAGLNLVEDASQVGDVLRLTPARKGRIGVAWYSVKQSVANGFSTTFEFQMTPDSASIPGKGFAFVVQNFRDHGSGSAIGYHGLENSIAVEFDTLQLSDWPEPNDNHISVHTRGVFANHVSEEYSIGIVTPDVDLNDDSGP